MLNRVVHDQGGRSQIPMHLRFARKTVVGDQNVIRRFVPKTGCEHTQQTAHLFNHLVGAGK